MNSWIRILREKNGYRKVVNAVPGILFLLCFTFLSDLTAVTLVISDSKVERVNKFILASFDQYLVIYKVTFL